MKPHDRPSLPPNHNTMDLIRKIIARSIIPPPPPPPIPPTYLFLTSHSPLSTIGTKYKTNLWFIFTAFHFLFYEYTRFF